MVLRSALLIILFWTSLASARAAAPTVVRWQKGTPGSDMEVRNGVITLLLAHDGFEVMLNLSGLQHFVKHGDWLAIASLLVSNQTAQRIEIRPSEMTLELIMPEHQLFSYQDPDSVAKRVGHTSRWAYVFAGMAGMGTQESHTTGTVTANDGSTATVDTTTTTRDSAAEDRAIHTIREGKRQRASTAAQFERDSLRDNTVFPGEHVSGFVYFAPPKHYKGRKAQEGEVDLRVPVSDLVFEFPFVWKAGK